MTRVPAATFEPPTLKTHATSAALWTVGLSYLAAVFPTMTLLSAAVGSENIEPLNRWYCRTQIRLTGARWRSVVDPQVDPKTPYMFLQNHTNQFDHVWMYDATPHFKQGVELASHFEYPIYGWFMRARGTIPVMPGREGQSPEVLAHMHREIAKNHSILAFPEGSRTVDGRLKPFRKGVFFIARDLGLPIVPTSVTGAFDVARKGSAQIRPGHQVTVYCDAPVETKGLPDRAIPELVAHVQDVMRKRVDGYWRERGWEHAESESDAAKARGPEELS